MKVIAATMILCASVALAQELPPMPPGMEPTKPSPKYAAKNPFTADGNAKMIKAAVIPLTQTFSCTWTHGNVTARLFWRDAFSKPWEMVGEYPVPVTNATVTVAYTASGMFNLGYVSP